MLNTIAIQGRFTKDPEIEQKNGTPYCRFSIANDKDYSKSERKEANFFNCIAFGKTAEFLPKYFKKGSQVNITGRLQSNKFTDSNGNSRTSIDIVVDRVDFCDSKSGEDGERYTPTERENPEPGRYDVGTGYDGYADDNVPF